MSARQAARWKRAACPALARDSFSKSKIWGRHRGFGMQLGGHRREARAQWALGPKAQSDPQVGSETSGGRGQRPPRRLSDRDREPSEPPEGGCGRKARRYAPRGAGRRVSCAARALETLARCGLRGWCGRTARAAGAGTRLPRRERAHAAELLTGGAGCIVPAGFAAACRKPRFLPPVAQSFALPCRSRSWFRCPASGRFGPSAQQPTGLTLPCAPQGRSKRLCGAGCAAGVGARRERWARAHAAGLPTGRGRMARRYAPPLAACRVSCPRLLNHSRFPDGRAHGFAALANIGVLCAAAHSPCICSHLRVALRFAQQPTGLTLPFGALRVALRFAQQPTGLTLPCAPQRRPMPQRAVKGQGPFDISERRPSPYRAQRGRPLTAAERANQHRAYQHERSTKTPCSN